MSKTNSARFSLRVLATALALGGVCLSAPSAFAGTTHRPIAEFVDAQGTFCFDDGAGGCTIFVPPVENFVAWTDTKHFLGASVDYAGLSDIPLGGSLGTAFSGTISERTLQDGSVIINVRLHTTNALTYVIPFDFNSSENQFGENPLIFGTRASDVLAGATPALASCQLDLEFTNSAPGLPIPDFEQLLFAAEPGQQILSVRFQATANGTFADGTPGKVQVIEKAILDNGFHGAVGDGFPAELINLIRQ
jgi:hypothetical protein